MKILFLAHRTPYPPNKGDKIRSFHLLAQLAKVHSISLLYWVDDPNDLAHTATLQSLCSGKVFPVRMNRFKAMTRAALSLMRGNSFSAGYYFANSFRRCLNAALRDGPFDVVFIFSSAMARYGEMIDAKIKVVDFVDVDSDKWGQLAKTAKFPLSVLYRAEERRLSRLEVDISAWASRNLFISRAEAALFKQRGGKGKIEVLPNGTDLELHRVPLQHLPFRASSADTRGGPKIVFVGTMNYQPNVDAVQYFVQQVFSEIRRYFPDAIFEIIGRNPPKSVIRLASCPGVRVTGDVADVRTLLLGADVSVAPMRIARGVQTKVLEAMAMGIPVVATAAAIQGIDVSDEQEVLVGNSPEEFARKVVRCLKDAELRKAITKRASTKMKEVYNWDLVGERLRNLLVEADPTKSARAHGHKFLSGNTDASVIEQGGKF